MGRTTPVRIAVALGAAAIVAASCSPTPEAAAPTTTLGTTTTTTTTIPPTTTTQADTGIPYGGVVVVADDQEPATLNPYAPRGDDFIVTIVGQAYFAGAYDIDGTTLEYTPEVVTELPTVANGGIVVHEDGTMTVTYTILDEAVWEDDVPISGDDFAFTVDMLQTPEADAGFQVDEAYGWVISYEAGPKTFEMTLSQPTVLHEQMFRVVIPKHAVEGSDFIADWNERMWPSGGPFRFSTWEQGERIVVERNDNYWKTDPETGQQLPYLDAVEFRFIPEVEEIIRSFKRRDVQVIQPPPVSATIGELVALESDGAAVDVVPGPVWEHLNFQFGPGRLGMNAASVNSNLDYRRAVAHLVDRDAIAAAVGAYTQPLSSYIDVFTPSLSQHAWDRYLYDPGKAEQLLLKVKAAEGIETVVSVFSTTSNGDTRIIVSEALRPMFEAVGIEYQTQLQDSQLFFGETLDSGTWDLGLWAWVGSPGFSGLIPIHDAFDPDAPPPDGSNYYRWGTEDSSVVDQHTERFAEVRDLMNSTVDEEELASLVAEAEDILASRMVILPLYAGPRVGAVWADEVGGFVMNPTRASHTWNIEEWYRADL
ncbi:MAG: ABC transporter substrate-binding protein [Acidimicrobiia bacterium]